MSETAQNPLNTFIIYAREDKDALLELKKQLIPLVRSRQIALWYDGEIVPGEVKEVCLSWPNYEQPPVEYWKIPRGKKRNTPTEWSKEEGGTTPPAEWSRCMELSRAGNEPLAPAGLTNTRSRRDSIH